MPLWWQEPRSVPTTVPGAGGSFFHKLRHDPHSCEVARHDVIVTSFTSVPSKIAIHCHHLHLRPQMSLNISTPVHGSTKVFAHRLQIRLTSTPLPAFEDFVAQERAPEPPVLFDVHRAGVLCQG